ncbi:MBL fold metallo-hydrolase [Hahella sp. CCB-MM4]|uniref:MBL fold metallo-hydrolase n=1 Tax=Hahella sp. (strain CCB-MM4) TaxID=1926491 RepID=UPI000B9B9A79|nr:ribonuclease Z [Hahella sp. CCB-MM4]OZG70747.1 MBL fold metallo-hydrolase [Hahella sp. CCB-MM4]
MHQLKIVGNGEAFSATNFNTSYLFKLIKGSILIDCGYQIPARLWLTGDHQEIDLILLTHFHADHAFGIVPLMVRYLEEKRTRPLHIWGPVGVRKYVMELLQMGYPNVSKYFQYPLEFAEFQEEIQDHRTFGGISIRSAPAIHSITNLVYRLDFDAGSFSVSGDGKPTELARELIAGVEIHFQETYEMEDRIPSHCSFEEVLQLVEANVCAAVGISHIARHQIEAMTKEYRRLVENELISERRLFMTYPGQEFEFNS